MLLLTSSRPKSESSFTFCFHMIPRPFLLELSKPLRSTPDDSGLPNDFACDDQAIGTAWAVYRREVCVDGRAALAGVTSESRASNIAPSCQTCCSRPGCVLCGTVPCCSSGTLSSHMIVSPHGITFACQCPCRSPTLHSSPSAPWTAAHALFRSQRKQVPNPSVSMRSRPAGSRAGVIPTPANLGKPCRCSPRLHEGLRPREVGLQLSGCHRRRATPRPHLLPSKMSSAAGIEVVGNRAPYRWNGRTVSSGRRPAHSAWTPTPRPASSRPSGKPPAPRWSTDP